MIKLTTEQRSSLEKIVARASNAAGVARRARVVLSSSPGERAVAIAERLDLSVEAVSRVASALGFTRWFANLPD